MVTAMATASGSQGDIPRIGGGSIANLRVKPREAQLNPPGISVLKAATPREAAEQMRTAFPKAVALHEAAKVVGTSTMEKIRAAGFDIIADPSRKLPNHHRLIHPDGAAGFNDENLRKLRDAFTDTSGV
jgi:hypothetical protein